MSEVYYTLEEILISTDTNYKLDVYQNPGDIMLQEKSQNISSIRSSHGIKVDSLHALIEARIKCEMTATKDRSKKSNRLDLNPQKEQNIKTWYGALMSKSPKLAYTNK